MSVSAVSASSPMDLSSASDAVTRAAKARAATTTSTTSTTGSTTDSSTSSSGLLATSTGTTFLNLLVKELQNQDPSAPMDSTAMVGQMISLNQLDQLISINQDLGGSTYSTGTTPSSTSGTGTTTTSTDGKAVSSSALMAARTSLLSGNTDTPAAAQAATIAASDPNSTLQLSTLNNLNGAK